MKTINLAIASMVLVLGMSVYGQAVGETPATTGFTASLLGSHHTSSGTTRQVETTRVSVDDHGAVLVTPTWTEVIRSTGNSPVGDWGVGNDTSSFVVSPSSWTGAVGTGSRAYNVNVARLATIDNPVVVKRVTWGDTIGAVVATEIMRVIMYDSRGSTEARFEKFNQIRSSNTQVQTELYFSSGVTIRKIGFGDVQIEATKQYK